MFSNIKEIRQRKRQKLRDQRILDGAPYKSEEHRHALDLFIGNTQDMLRPGKIEKKGDIFLLPRGKSEESLISYANTLLHACDYKLYGEVAEEILLAEKTDKEFQSLEEAIETANDIQYKNNPEQGGLAGGDGVFRIPANLING